MVIRQGGLKKSGTVSARLPVWFKLVPGTVATSHSSLNSYCLRKIILTHFVTVILLVASACGFS